MFKVKNKTISVQLFRLYCKGLKTFSTKGQIVSILGFVGHTITVTMTQLCYCCVKAAIENI